MPIKSKTMTTTTATLPALLVDAATSAHDALAVGRQMMDMLREYTALEAQHASRVQRLAKRMGDCVDRMRLKSPKNNNQDEHDDEDDEDHDLRKRQSQCVAVMDEVVTFLTRFGSMHRHLSECLAGDLFDEWSDVLDTQTKRVGSHEPELRSSQQQLETAEQEYRHTHALFQAEFDNACTAYTGLMEVNAEDAEHVESLVQAQLATSSEAPVAHSRERASSKAMQYVDSLSRFLLPSPKGSRSGARRRLSVSGSHTDSSNGENQLEADIRTASDTVAFAEQRRQQCREAFQAMHRLHVRHTRLCDSLFQEYQCVQGECLTSTKTSIRKLVIHLSAFTSNLQYDATQLFQQVEALHAVDLNAPNALHSPFSTSAGSAPSSSHPAPPLDQPLTLQHVSRRHFPVMNARPRLLRHQNALHALAV